MRTTTFFIALAAACSTLAAEPADSVEGATEPRIPIARSPQQLEDIMSRHVANARVHVTNLMTGTSTTTDGTLELQNSGTVVEFGTPPLPAGRHRFWIPMKLVPYDDGRVRDLAVSVKAGDRSRVLVMGDFSPQQEFQNFFLDFTVREREARQLVITWEVGRFSREDRDKSLAKHAPESVQPSAGTLLTEDTGEEEEEEEDPDLEEEEEGDSADKKTVSFEEAARIEVRLEVLPPVIEANVVKAASLLTDSLPYEPGEGVFPLCVEGKAAAGIVVSPEVRKSVVKMTGLAPDILRDELRFVTGARFHIGGRGYDQTIEIGQTAAAQREGIPDLAESLLPDGFCLRVTPEKLFICGPTPSGTATGVYYFLNNVLHVRKYHAYGLFHAAPYAPNASLPTGELKLKPDFRLRAFSTGGFYREHCPRSDVWWQPYNGIQYHTDSCPQPFLFHHGMVGVFQTYNQAMTQEKLRAKEQDFLKKATAAGDGLGLDEEDAPDGTEEDAGFGEELAKDLDEEQVPKKKTREELLYDILDHCLPKDLPEEKREASVRKVLARKAGWQPCYSHAETVRICTEAAIATFTDDPELQAFSVGMNDSGGFCFCGECRKLLEGEPLVTEGSYKYWNQGSIYYHMMNKVAENVDKEFPGKMVGGLCYHYTTSPPRQYKLRDNIFLLRNFYLANTPPDWVEKTLRPWEGKAAHVGIYEYAYPTTVPRFNLHNLQPILRKRKEKGGNFFYAEVYPDWQIEGPKYWLMTRVLWDNDADVKRLMAEYCRDLFGAASEPMLEYWDLCARIVPESAERGRSLSPYGNPLSRAVVIYPYIERMKELLAKAEAMAKTRIVKERIRYFRGPVEVDMDLLARIGKAYMSGVATQASPEAVLNSAVAAVVKLGELEKELGKIKHDCGLARRDMPPSSYAGGIGATITAQIGGMLAQRLREKAETDWRALSREAEQAIQAAEKRFPKDPEKQALGWLKERMNHVFKGSMNAVPEVENPIETDGVAEDAFLKQALKLTFYRYSVVPRRSKEEPKLVESDWTEVYIGHDAAALYFTVRSAESAPSVFEGHSQDGNYNMFTGDAMTFHFAPLAGAGIALRITIDVRGKVYAWNPPERLAQAYDKEKKVWTVELALPWDNVYFKEHKVKPGAFELLRANFLRHYKTPEHQFFRGHGPATRASSWFAPAARAPAGRSPGQTGLLILE